MKLEIERKWLLYRFPVFPQEIMESVVSLDLYQFYTDAGRYRCEMHETEAADKYFHTTKKLIEAGVYEETEVEISEEEFEKMLEHSTGAVEKTRYVWPLDEECTLFLDALTTGTILLEVEMPRLGMKIELPEFLQDCVYAEVTHDSRFTNYNLRTQE